MDDLEKIDKIDGDDEIVDPTWKPQQLLHDYNKAANDNDSTPNELLVQEHHLLNFLLSTRCTKPLIGIHVTCFYFFQFKDVPRGKKCERRTQRHCFPVTSVVVVPALP